MDAIRTDGLTRRFGDLAAVDHLSFTVAEGELFGLVGPDGAGKTTAMRLLAGILDPTSGDAWVAGLHTVRESGAIQDRIGYMSQRFGLYPDLTVMENLDFYADIYGVPRRGRMEAVDRLLAFSRLAPFRERRAGHLSGGMKQKLGLACALVHTPRILLLDEPTNGVDPVSRRDFWRILYQLVREGVTVFVSTAYMDEAERCGRLALLHRGRLLAAGSPGEIKTMVRDAILEVLAPDARRAADALRAAMPGAAVHLFGDRVHVSAPRAEAAAGDAGRALRDAGIDGAVVRPAAPSLEDVFVSAIGGAAGSPATGPGATERIHDGQC